MDVTRIVDGIGLVIGLLLLEVLLYLVFTFLLECLLMLSRTINKEERDQVLPIYARLLVLFAGMSLGLAVIAYLIKQLVDSTWSTWVIWALLVPIGLLAIVRRTASFLRREYSPLPIRKRKPADYVL